MAERHSERGNDGRFAVAGAGTQAKRQDGNPKRQDARPKRQDAKPKRRRWSAEAEATFFRELATLCNVAAALRDAGLACHSRDVYDRRKRDARFRAAWDGAIDQSYAALELEMLARARHGSRRAEPSDAAEKRLREVPSGLGLQLLKLHQSRKARPAPPEARRGRKLLTGRALRAEIERRLSELNRRMGGNG